MTELLIFYFRAIFPIFSSTVPTFLIERSDVTKVRLSIDEINVTFGSFALTLANTLLMEIMNKIGKTVKSYNILISTFCFGFVNLSMTSFINLLVKNNYV